MRTLDIPVSPAARREWIKYRLRLAGHTFGSIARELCVSRYAPQKALWVQRPRMEAAIAERIGIPARRLWPERYDGNGTPKRKQRGRPRAKHPRRNPHADQLTTHDGQEGNVQREEAA